jgi:hypothetical protein
MAAIKLPSIPKLAAPRQAKTPPVKGPEFQKAPEVSGIEAPRRIRLFKTSPASAPVHWSGK